MLNLRRICQNSVLFVSISMGNLKGYSKNQYEILLQGVEEFILEGVLSGADQNHKF